MGPYSHYTLAARLEPSLKTDNRAAYYFGSVIPDVRYLARMRRDQTHLSQERLRALLACYPHLRDFLLGYQVHCLTDQIDVARVVGGAFPLSLLGRVMGKRPSPQQMVMMVEMYYLQSAAPVAVPLAGEHNEVLADLGITAQQVSVFQREIGEYFEARTVEAALSAQQQIGIIENNRLEKYKHALQSMQKKKVLLTVMMLSIKNARIDQRVMDHVRANVAAR